MIPSVQVNNFSIGRPNQLVLISGPCVIEDESITFNIASKLKRLTDELEIPFIFKASYDKANRTSIDSYRGPGIEKGLDVLSSIKKGPSISGGRNNSIIFVGPVIVLFELSLAII